MLKAQYLIDYDGHYVNATQPGDQSLIYRILDAWEVIMGRAEAVKWERQ